MSTITQRGTAIGIPSDARTSESERLDNERTGELDHTAQRFLKSVVNHDRQEARTLKASSRDRRITSCHRSEHLRVLGARSEARASDLALEVQP